ncbi:hypothetical protein [Actinoplanes sp. NPDC051859]|uniref:hypothetical protein n=1 Tax=Actinoplanes sp. NPDC051859 TaxID=3363909 RepID=UPI00379AE363
MSGADDAAAIRLLAESCPPLEALAAMSDELDRIAARLHRLVGDSHNDFIVGAHYKIRLAKEDLECVGIAIGGVRESLHSYARGIAPAS